MKRTLITATFLALFSMAFAGPPVDVQLTCGEGEDAPLVGVASLVEDQVHVALIDGALAACVDGVFAVADGATLFTVTYTVDPDSGAITDVQVAFDDPDDLPELTYQEVPEVAVEGKLGAQQNRAAARERAAEARAHADERGDGPPAHARGGGDDEEEEEEDEDVEDEASDGPPADPTGSAASGRR